MICFCWSGFPQYAARCVGAFVGAADSRVMVYATRPRVPVRGMEELCRCPVKWIDGDEEIDAEGIDVVFITGWHIKPFVNLCAKVRSNGGRAICMVDNNYVAPRGLADMAGHFVRRLRFRLFKDGLFDGYMVPGKSGVLLLKGYGVADRRMAEGMYSADASLFKAGLPLENRPKRIIYVGQFSERKNVRRLCEAYGGIAEKNGWELHLYGCGPVEIPSSNGIVVHPFLQPEELAEEYRKARIFCLPSLEEHWGLVVHEAALSGCALCLSDRVGAADDFLSPDNGRFFNPYDTCDISAKLEDMMHWSSAEMKRANDKSISMASAHSLDTFVHGVCRMSGINWSEAVR